LLGRFNALPIEEVARVVADRVEQLVQIHRRERIDVVGRSAGGRSITSSSGAGATCRSSTTGIGEPRHAAPALLRTSARSGASSGASWQVSIRFHRRPWGEPLSHPLLTVI
jgi:hypothetical protein